jgi:hypothetical protein
MIIPPLHDLFREVAVKSKSRSVQLLWRAIKKLTYTSASITRWFADARSGGSAERGCRADWRALYRAVFGTEPDTPTTVTR